MDELKPCPFCNKPPITTPSGEGGNGLMIECLTEGCVNPHVSYYNHDVARTAWNTRPREDAGVVDEWRPIECYPNDSLPRLFLCRGKVVQGFKDATGELCVQHELGWRVMRRRPSHWREIPPGATATLAAVLGKSNG